MSTYFLLSTDIIYRSKKIITTFNMDDDFNVTKPDSLAQLKKQLEYIIAITPENRKPLLEAEFSAYTHLFQRYLEESESSIEWNRIENLPDNRVNT